MFLYTILKCGKVLKIIKEEVKKGTAFIKQHADLSDKAKANWKHRLFYIYIITSDIAKENHLPMVVLFILERKNYLI